MPLRLGLLSKPNEEENEWTEFEAIRFEDGPSSSELGGDFSRLALVCDVDQSSTCNRVDSTSLRVRLSRFEVLHALLSDETKDRSTLFRVSLGELLFKVVPGTRLAKPQAVVSSGALYP